MRVIFWGSPPFAIPTLRALNESEHDVIAVVSQPDKPTGRRRRLQPPAVIEYAQEQNLLTLQPASPKNTEFRAKLQALAPEVMVIVAYGKILSKKILAIPGHGCVNVHFSLLPRYRGASPIASAILEGDTTTGITIMQMSAKMDEGPIFTLEETQIADDETTGELEERLGELAPGVLLEVLAQIAAGTSTATPQKHEEASYCGILTKQDGKISWDKTASYLARFIRARSPWPTAYCQLRRAKDPDKPLDIIFWKAMALDREIDALPGTIVEVNKKDIVIATRQGCLRLLRLQRRGKSPLSTAEFMRGNPIAVGDVFC